MMLFVLLLCLLQALTTSHSFLVKEATTHSARSRVLLVDSDAHENETCHCNDESFRSADLCHRRCVPSRVAKGIFSAWIAFSRPATANQKDNLSTVTDSNSYSALVYSNPKNIGNQNNKAPMLLVLHGAGNNQEGVWSLADIKGEHAGLLPSLIANNQAPSGVENFVVVAPYSAGKRSFYEEPRSRLLKFVEWICSDEGQKAGVPSNIDPNRIFLFGFSDGATVAVELATTRRFKACVICAYGFSGILPQLALDRLKDIPFWVFHSADDVIFPVKYGDQLVKSLRSVSRPDLVRYTRFDMDQEGFTGDVRGHSVGITASKMPAVYDWLLSIP